MGFFTGENFPQQTNPLSKHYPLVNIQKAIENGPVDIVDLPINSMVIFHSFLYVYQRVKPPLSWGTSPPCEFIRGRQFARDVTAAGATEAPTEKGDTDWVRWRWKSLVNYGRYTIVYKGYSYDEWVYKCL